MSQSCLTLSNLIDCCPQVSSVHGILHARVLEWIAILFSKGPSQPRDQQHLLHCRQILYHLSHHEARSQKYIFNQSSTAFLKLVSNVVCGSQTGAKKKKMSLADALAKIPTEPITNPLRTWEVNVLPNPELF